MAIPNSFIEELRSRVSLAQVVGRRVNWDPKKTKVAKGDYWACCPFHAEKTPSFHVDDLKGFYYCFGCQERGEVFSFLTKVNNLNFRDAVEMLAAEVGMQVPQDDPRAVERAKQAKSLYDILEQAVRYFRHGLETSTGRAAREYLSGRKISDDSRRTFELGFAPDQRSALTDFLRHQEIEMKKIIEAGLAAIPENGGNPYDRFRNRIIFPIRDLRGRAIAFGGRAMNPNTPAKYLNSPETPIFKKGSCLYNHLAARDARGKTAQLLVVEGYIDVIALSQAGFASTVAPLGTAITDTQLRNLWKMAEEPVLALDGDEAGLAAAMRTIDLALPLLRPGYSLRFCILPENTDPDDLVRNQGHAAMLSLVEDAMPLSDFIWFRETRNQGFTTPEQKARLEARLHGAASAIRDTSVQAHYRQYFRSKLAEQFGGFRPRSNWRRPGRNRIHMPSHEAKASALVRSSNSREFAERLQEAAIICICLSNPTIVSDFVMKLEELEFRNGNNSAIMRNLLRFAAEYSEDYDQFRRALEDEVGARALNDLLATKQIANVPAARGSVEVGIARTSLAEVLARLESERRTGSELTELKDEIREGAPGNLAWRLEESIKQRDEARQGFTEEDDESQYFSAPNGISVRKSEIDELRRLVEAPLSGGSQ